MMRAIVIGSAAGGGVPQWNCACAGCAAARAGRAPSRTQASVAVSADGERWYLLGASPDLRSQIEATPALRPSPPRRSPIAGVLLPNAELDSTLGLFSLRERHAFTIHATDAVLAGVARANAMSRALARAAWHALAPGVETEIDAGLSVTAVPAPGKVPNHLAGTGFTGDNVGLVVRAAGRSLAYFPSVAAPSLEVERAAREADVVLWDGTFWTEAGLADAGVGTATAAEMAHWPLGGEGGSLRWLAALPARRRLLVHVNNTNPVLQPGSDEARAVAAAGVEIAEDGMEVSP